ncbi:beta-Ig-H3/fasciclin [Cylindrospermum sp. NIES-4074]|nr:beta-Ig-H3/fasciclin [Cylindrospermum sp. NIES-4074]
MKTNYLTQLAKKLAVITGIIAVTASLSIPVMAQNRPDTPDTTPATPGTTQPPARRRPTTPPGTGRGNLLQVAESNPSLRTLVRAVEAAGLSDTLAKGRYTIFAPTDQAFNDSLPAGGVDFLLRPENKDLLGQVIRYHVIPGRVNSKQLKSGTLKTLGGGVAVRVEGNRVIVNDATVIQPDIQATNGVIHTVNRLILPRELRETIESRLGRQTPTPR